MEAGIAARPSGASSADRMPADPPSRRPPTSQMDDTGAGEWPSGTPDGWGSLVDLHLDAAGTKGDLGTLRGGNQLDRDPVLVLHHRRTRSSGRRQSGTGGRVVAGVGVHWGGGTLNYKGKEY